MSSQTSVSLGSDQASSSDPSSEENDSTPAIVIFNILTFLALIILCMLLGAAVVSKSIHRMKTWFILVITFIVYCVSFLLLLGHQSGPEPSFGLCMFQSGMIYAAPPFSATACLLFIVELHLRLTSIYSEKMISESIMPKLLWSVPITHIIIFWESVLIGLEDPSTIRRPAAFAMYCAITQTRPRLITGGLVIFQMLLMMLLELYTVLILLRRMGRPTIRKMLRDGDSTPAFPLDMFLRVALYTMISVGVIIVVIILNTKLEDVNAIYLFPMIPLSVGLLFFSQSDILQFYLFWRKPAYPRLPLP